jgi:NADPH:quinone reductase
LDRARPRHAGADTLAGQTIDRLTLENLMRALVVREFGPIENVKLDEMPKPAPKPGEVLLESHAVAVNFVDLIMISGKYQFKPALPFVPGKLPAGVVAAVGLGVKNFKPGDHAIAMVEQGGFAEFTTAPEDQCVKLPGTLKLADAAAMALIFDTAWFALRDRARIAPGETVLVLGATGGVGLAAIQLAKAFGAKVLAGVSSADKGEIVRAAGADAIIDLAAPNLHDALRDQVYAQTDKNGADVILDMLGGDIFDAAIRALAWRGRLVVIGFASGRIPTLKANYLLLKNIEVSGLQVSDYRKRKPQEMQACFQDIFSLLAAGKLQPPPSKVYPLAQFAAAMHDIQDRKQRGRVVLAIKD